MSFFSRIFGRGRPTPNLPRVVDASPTEVPPWAVRLYPPSIEIDEEACGDSGTTYVQCKTCRRNIWPGVAAALNGNCPGCEVIAIQDSHSSGVPVACSGINPFWLLAAQDGIFFFFDCDGDKFIPRPSHGRGIKARFVRQVDEPPGGIKGTYAQFEILVSLNEVLDRFDVGIIQKHWGHVPDRGELVLCRHGNIYRGRPNGYWFIWGRA